MNKLHKILKLVPFIPHFLRGERFLLIRTNAILQCAEHGVIARFSWPPNRGLVYPTSMGFCPECKKRLKMVPQYNSVPILCYCGLHKTKKGIFHGWHFEICVRCNYQKWSVKGPAIVGLPPNNIFSPHYNEWENFETKLKGKTSRPI